MIELPSKHILAKVGHRVRQFRSVWTDGGAQGIIDRLRRGAVARLAPSTTPLPVRTSDILACDLTFPKKWPTLLINPGQPLEINWITTPPSRGSGGHTTMFRLIDYLQRSGHTCRVYIYDANGGDAAYYASLARSIFPKFRGEINDVTDGMADAHAVVATSWQTAYPAYRSSSSGKRFYLVQDFEPWFYPVSGHSILAENTYRMGFHAVTAGRFLATKMRKEYGMAADAFDFGCDTDKYRLLESSAQRDGIIFYAKPEVPRRAYELGMLALRLFAERYPNLTVHFYGGSVGEQPFRFINHGVISPDELNRLYNRCFAGLCLSMTNVSLVPHEMLAAGCIPVSNDSEHNRIVLDNSFVRYARPTPHALCAALGEVVNSPDFSALAVAASQSVSSASWEAAGATVERSIRRALLDEADAPARLKQ
jgi:O-antigen biosynthesis protein